MALRTLLLISPPVLHGQRWWANRIANKPHLASLTGFVRDLAATRTLELDLDSGTPLPLLLSQVDEALRGEVALVGISCWTSMHYLGARAVAERVRALRPELPIAIGGHHATAVPADFDREVCDWLIRGDGEHPLRRLCTDWPGRPARLEVLEGGVFEQTDPSHIDWDHYLRPGERPRAVWVGTSRGCAFQCRYCVEPGRGAAYSRYEVPAQLDVLERLVEKHGPRVIAFSDPLFGANRHWLESFLDGVERRALPLLFWCETRADLMSPELLERFKRCRFMVDFGLDTGSRAMIERMQKAALPDVYLERARATLEGANRIGLPHGVYLIFNYPGETPETAAETRAFIDGLGAGGGPMSGWLSAQAFFILPGTSSYARMAEDQARFGSEIRNPRWWTQAGDHHALATDVLPSAAWRGREAELTAFQEWNQAVNLRWYLRYPPGVHEFREAFYGAGADMGEPRGEGSLVD